MTSKPKTFKDYLIRLILNLVIIIPLYAFIFNYNPLGDIIDYLLFIIAGGILTDILDYYIKKYNIVKFEERHSYAKQLYLKIFKK